MNAEEEIRQAVANWSRAVEAKHPDAIVKDYAPDARLFDAIPPFATKGKENIRAIWATGQTQSAQMRP